MKEMKDQKMQIPQPVSDQYPEVLFKYFKKISFDAS